MKLTYHTEGTRAFLLEEDGTTVCEVLPPLHGTPAAVVASNIVRRWNAAPDLLAALLAFRDAGCAGVQEFHGWHAKYQPAIELARAAIAKATGGKE